MRRCIFDKAKDITINGKIEFDGEGDNTEYFKVTTPKNTVYNVYLNYDDKGKLGYSCDCQYMGVQGIVKGTFCSHILAVFNWKIEKQVTTKS